MGKNKLGMMIMITGLVVVLAIGGLLFNQYRNHQANLLIIEKCYEDFDQEGKVVIKKEGFWSPVVCEK